MTKARVESYHGSPAILIDGEPFPPMLATIRTNKRDSLQLNPDYFRRLGDAGVKIYFVICDTEWLKPGAVAQFRTEAETLLQAVPDAWIMPRIGLHPPLTWIHEHPDELVQFDDGLSEPVHLYTESYEADLPAMYSLCSAQWRQDAGRALAETYAAIERMPFADRIIGYFLAAGNTSEWYYSGTVRDQAVSDVSPAFRRQFSAFLTEKYGTDAALQKAWRRMDVSLAQPAIPGKDDRFFIQGIDAALRNPPRLYSTSPKPEPPRHPACVGEFLNLASHQAVADYYRAWHLGTAESIIYFADIIKAKSQDKLVGAFYGSYGCTDFFDNGSAGGVLRILDAGTVDFLAAPGVYENRQPGGFTGQREMVDSFRLRNCMFIVEEDTRTHEENAFYQNFVEMYTVGQTLNVMKRDFGRNICEDLQAWWFDQHIGGARYKSPEVLQLIARQQQIAREFYAGDRRKQNEIAFIYDEESIHLVSQSATQETVELMRNYEISRIGASADQYYHNDLANPGLPAYKLYVFFNVYSLTDQERRDIWNKLRADHAVALWLYAPGVVNPDRDPAFAPDYISELVGMSVTMTDTDLSPKFMINGEPHPAMTDTDPGEIYGFNYRLMLSNTQPRFGNSYSYLYPAFYTQDPTATVAARFLENNQPAVSIKELDGWTSIFCGARQVRSDFLRSVARYAGCHIFCDSDEVIYASRRYLTIHAAASGTKTLHFPVPCHPYEVYEQAYYGQAVTSIALPMLKGETRMFELR